MYACMHAYMHTYHTYISYIMHTDRMHHGTASSWSVTVPRAGAGCATREPVRGGSSGPVVRARPEARGRRAMGRWLPGCAPRGGAHAGRWMDGCVCEEGEEAETGSISTSISTSAHTNAWSCVICIYAYTHMSIPIHKQTCVQAPCIHTYMHASYKHTYVQAP